MPTAMVDSVLEPIINYTNDEDIKQMGYLKDADLFEKGWADVKVAGEFFTMSLI